MTLPKWLDRLWLTLIAISFLVIVPLYTLMWIERIGWKNVALAVLAFFAAGFFSQLSGIRR